jgi:hypothetical protein
MSTQKEAEWAKIEASIEGWEIPVTLRLVIDKVNEGDDDLTLSEQKDWLEYFLLVISDNYTLTPTEMLSDHDSWLKCIQYYSGIDEDKMQLFLEKVPEMKRLSLDAFLSLVVKYFTIEELKSAM